MIRVLENFYDDPRTKIVVCSSEALCEQFYTRFSTAGTRYGTGAPLRNTQNPNNQRTTIGHLQNGFEITRKGFQPQHSSIQQDNSHRSACIFVDSGGPVLIVTLDYLDQLREQITDRPHEHQAAIQGTDPMKRGMGTIRNMLSNKIILFDEFHVVFDPTRSYLSRRIFRTDKSPELRKNGKFDPKHIRNLLATTFGTVLGAFTATMPREHLKECHRVITMNTDQSVPPDFTGYLHVFESTSKPSDVFLVQQKHLIDLEIPTTKELTSRLQICGGAFAEDPEYTIDTHRSVVRNTTCIPAQMSITEQDKIAADLSTYAPKIAKMMDDLDGVLDTKAPNTERNGILILATLATGLLFVPTLLEKKNISYVYISESLSDDGRYWYNAESTASTASQKRTHFETVEDTIQFWTESQTKLDPDSQDTCSLRVVILDTKSMPEGLDLIGIDTVFGLSEYTDAESMVQAFGRADRMCTRRYFSNNRDSRSLEMTQYAFKDDAYVQEWANPPDVTTGSPISGRSFGRHES
jgi:hypothetical protein